MATTYKEVASKHALTESQAKKFCQFLHRRHPGDETTVCLTGQASRWANIFKEGQEEVQCTEQDRGIFKAIAEENAGATEQKPAVPDLKIEKKDAPEKKKENIVQKIAKKITEKKSVAKKDKK